MNKNIPARPHCVQVKHLLKINKVGPYQPHLGMRLHLALVKLLTKGQV